jgi:hypothetical protein
MLDDNARNRITLMRIIIIVLARKTLFKGLGMKKIPDNNLL